MRYYQEFACSLLGQHTHRQGGKSEGLEHTASERQELMHLVFRESLTYTCGKAQDKLYIRYRVKAE